MSFKFSRSVEDNASMTKTYYPSSNSVSGRDKGSFCKISVNASIIRHDLILKHIMSILPNTFIATVILGLTLKHVTCNIIFILLYT